MAAGKTGKGIVKKGMIFCVAGESLSLGYYHNPAETEKSFQERLFPDGRKERYYRTGDLGFLGKDGNLYFSGRKDFQIKFNGHRIELEEIERLLDQMQGIEKSCCVTDQAAGQSWKWEGPSGYAHIFSVALYYGLILGDSLSYTSFSPMQMWNEYGISAFVGGQSGQNIQESYYMLKKAFKNQKPRLVILETNVLFRPQEGASGLTMTLAAAGSYYFPVFTYHDIWKSILTGKEYPEENYKGFQFREVTNPYRGGAYMKETAAKEKISRTVEEYLEKIRSLCRKNQAELVLVSTPSPLNYNYRKYNTLKEYAEQREIPGSVK